VGWAKMPFSKNRIVGALFWPKNELDLGGSTVYRRPCSPRLVTPKVPVRGDASFCAGISGRELLRDRRTLEGNVRRKRLPATPHVLATRDCLSLSEWTGRDMVKSTGHWSMTGGKSQSVRPRKRTRRTDHLRSLRSASSLV
jgi:hypothetical protein